MAHLHVSRAFTLTLVTLGAVLFTFGRFTLSISARSHRETPHQPAIAICTSELEHITAGGAGVVVADSARALAQAGWRVLVVLDIVDSDAEAVARAWARRMTREWGDSGSRNGRSSTPLSLSAVTLAELVKDAPAQANAYPAHLGRVLWLKSQQWARAVAQIAQACDAIEFWDCGAPAYHTLLERLRTVRRTPASASPAIQARPRGPAIWVRTHGLHQDILLHNEARIGLGNNNNKNDNTNNDRIATLVVYAMERRALQLADAVIANGPGTANQYMKAHDLDPARVVVIPPTLGTLPLPMHHATSKGGTGYPRPPPLDMLSNILVYGKLQRVKGPDLAARALVQVMRDLAGQWSGNVIFAGDDTPCDVQPTINMSKCILEQDVPANHEIRHRFRFLGRIRRGELGRVAARHLVGLVILPSRYETFCLAAHEAAYFGLPIVLPHLPAYDGFFVDGISALMFDPGSVEDLARVVKRALLNGGDMPSTHGRGRRRIEYPDPTAGYGALLALDSKV